MMVFFHTTCLDVLCLFSQGDLKIAKPHMFRHVFKLGCANRKEQISKNYDDMINYTYWNLPKPCNAGRY